jgi:hypothetical protein
MANPYPDLNVEVMRKLYEEFGGLYAYQVEYLDLVLFRVTTSNSSFNEKSVDDEVARLRAAGIPAVKKQLLIKFEGAFAK